jgi:hypothetical protein
VIDVDYCSGGIWPGEPADPLERILGRVAKHPLMNLSGIERATWSDRPVTYVIFGNFIDLSGSFSFETDESEVIDRFTKAFLANYKRFAPERRQEERESAERQRRKAFP